MLFSIKFEWGNTKRVNSIKDRSVKYDFGIFQHSTFEMNRAVFQVSLRVVRKMIKGELFEGEEDPV